MKHSRKSNGSSLRGTQGNQRLRKKEGIGDLGVSTQNSSGVQLESYIEVC